MAAALPVVFQILVQGKSSTQVDNGCWLQKECQSRHWKFCKASSTCDIKKDEFTYTMTCSPNERYDEDSDDRGWAIVTFPHGTSCDELVRSNGAVSGYSLYYDWLLSDHVLVPLFPQTRRQELKQYPLAKHMFPKDTKRADACFEGPTLCTLQVFTGNVVFGKGVCTLLQKVSCNRECSNGQVRSRRCFACCIRLVSDQVACLAVCRGIYDDGHGSLPLFEMRANWLTLFPTQETALYNKTAVCVACAPGTWNTCLGQDTCKW